MSICELIAKLRHRGHRSARRFVGRMRTRDISYGYRMPGGVQGDITRPEPTVEPCLMDPDNPVTAYGLAVMADETSENAVRAVAVADENGTAIYGIGVRPYPYQQGSTTNFGAANTGASTPSTNQPLGVLRRGYVLVPCNGAPTKGAPVYVWAAASAGDHVQGGFETDNPGGSGIALDSKTTFQGGLDANGLAEIGFNL